MAREQEIVGSLKPVEIEAYERVGNQNYRMESIGHEVLDPVQPGQRTTILAAKSNVAAKLRNRAARFLPANEPAAGAFLMLHRKIRVTPDADLLEMASCAFRQHPSASGRQLFSSLSGHTSSISHIARLGHAR